VTVKTLRRSVIQRLTSGSKSDSIGHISLVTSGAPEPFKLS